MSQSDDATRRLESQLIVAAFARVRSGALGCAVGIVCGLALFLATAVLLIAAGNPADDTHVGPHLSLLGHFLPGYQVTWFGAVLGLLYGVIVGFVAGAVLGWLLNLSHAVYVRVIQRGLKSGVMHDAL